MRRLLLALVTLTAACTDKTPGRIIVFDGYGSPAAATVSGRVLTNAPNKTPDEKRSAVDNLADNAAMFETDEVEGAVLELELAGKKVSATTDRDGVFTATFTGPIPEGTLAVRARVTEDKGHPTPEAGGMIHILGDRDGVAVISDFDDTIVKTEVTEPEKMIANTALRNPAQIPLVEDVDRALGEAANAGAAGFFYLSGSPHNLYERIASVMSLRKLPRGPILLKNFGDDALVEQQGYKTKRLRELMTQFPRLKFVLIGDTGERDPEIYRAIAAESPDRVAGILIRRTAGSNLDPARFENCTLIDDYRGDPSPIAEIIRRAASRSDDRSDTPPAPDGTGR